MTEREEPRRTLSFRAWSLHAGGGQTVLIHRQPETSTVKILLTGEDSIRLEPTEGQMTIEAPDADRQYSPFHMLGSALAYCTFSVLYSWASHANLSIDGMQVDVAWQFSKEEPKRVSAISLDFKWPSLPPARLTAAKRVAALCTIHETLLHPPTMTIEGAT